MANYLDYLEFAIGLAKECGQFSRAFLKEPFTIRRKGKSNKNLVTPADEAIETKISQAIRAHYPSHNILGEECEKAPLVSGEMLWIIDPIDGTTNFCRLTIHYAISIALYDEKGEGIVGVVYDPSRDECFYAAKGLGAFLNGTELKFDDTLILKDAVISGGLFVQDDVFTIRIREWMLRLHKESLGTRIMACASLEMCYVACGRLGMYIAKSLQPWDVAAALVILNEIGYTSQRLDDQPFNILKQGSLVVANPRVFNEAYPLF